MTDQDRGVNHEKGAVFADLDYEPITGLWICADHGMPDCEQSEKCRALPWSLTEDLALWPFTDWADAKFRGIVRNYDCGEVATMPDAAFDAYNVAQFVEATNV